MTREAHDLILSLHSVTIAQTLMACERTILPEDHSLTEDTWKSISRTDRERLMTAAHIAIRGLDEGVRAVASYEAREIFVREFQGWAPNSLQHSRIQKAFDDALAHYRQQLADGPLPIAKPTAEEEAAYDDGIRPLEDDLIREDLTGHGRY